MRLRILQTPRLARFLNPRRKLEQVCAIHKIVDRLRQLSDTIVGQGGSSAQARLNQLPDADADSEWNGFHKL